MKLYSGDATIRYLDDLPHSVPAFICESPDGHTNIYVNSRLNHIQQREGLKHEIDHYLRDDLHRDVGIREIEGSEHKRLPRLFRASELLSKPLEPRKRRPDPTPAPRSTPAPISGHQWKVVLRALSEIDRSIIQENDRILASIENRMAEPW